VLSFGSTISSPGADREIFAVVISNLSISANLPSIAFYGAGPPNVLRSFDGLDIPLWERVVVDIDFTLKRQVDWLLFTCTQLFNLVKNISSAKVTIPF
jgi:hypothetical protein